MKWVLAGLLAISVLTSGCASFGYAIRETPRRTAEALRDPVRRTHLLAQSSRIAGTASVGIGCVAILSPTIVGTLVCPLVALLYDYIMFEYVLEPISKDLVKDGKPSLVGPFWETGPRIEEGEFFNGCEKPTPTCRPPGPTKANP